MKNLNNYHSICEALNFDLYLVSSVISHFHLDDTDKIFANIQNLKIDIYEDAISECLELHSDELELLKESIGFKNEFSYINYLTSLLELNNIFFIDYRQKENKKENKYQTLSLFND